MPGRRSTSRDSPATFGRAPNGHARPSQTAPRPRRSSASWPPSRRLRRLPEPVLVLSNHTDDDALDQHVVFVRTDWTHGGVRRLQANPAARLTEESLDG